MTSRTDPLQIAIIGAGIIGLTAAYELAVRRGARVTLFDTRAPGRGASWAAAGMIAPAFEAAAEPGVHPQLFDLCMQSAAMWPAFAAELTRRSGLPAGLDVEASLAVALDAAEAGRLARITDTLKARGVPHAALTGAEARANEPALSGEVRGGLELPTDFRVNNRQAVDALLAALRREAKVTFIEGPAPLKSVYGRVVLEGHDKVLIAAGWESAVVRVVDAGAFRNLAFWDTALSAIDCHGGQMLSVAAGPGAPRRIVRSGHVYLVPRGTEIVIGATTEPGRATTEPEDRVLAGLRAEAVRLCPGLAEAPVLERWAGIRPGTPDHAPLIGETAESGIFIAAGHYRNGILLAPVTAMLIADAMLGAPPGALAETFRPSRRMPAATA
jgi:glycine oxidase